MLKLTLSLTLALTLPLILICFLTPYFHNALSRYEVYANFPHDNIYENLYINSYKRTEDDLWKKFYSVLEYIRPPFNAELDHEFFAPEDIYHMQDVRNLFILVWVISLTSATCLVLRKLIWKKRVIVNVTKQRKLRISFVAVSLIIGSLLLLTWDSSFVIFHQLFFSGNNYWQLDPATSNLIKFLPGQIFQELLLIYIGLIIVVEFFTSKLASWLDRQLAS